MKKLITILSLVVVLSFGITVCIRLIPQKSREGIPPATEETSPTPTKTSSPVVPPRDTDTEPYPLLTLGGDTHTEDVTVDGTTIGSISFFIPKLSYPDFQEVAEKINNVMKTKAEEHINNYREECNFLSMDFDPDEMSPYEYISSSRLYVSESTVSIKMVTEINYSSVLTEKTVFCYNFSITTGEEISLDDTGIDKLSLINAIIEKTLTITEYEFTPNYQNYIKEHVCNSWYIDQNTIYLIYVPLEITDGIHGTIEIPVALDTL